MTEYMVHGTRNGNKFQAPTTAESAIDARISFLASVVDGDVDDAEMTNEEYAEELEVSSEFSVAEVTERRV